MTHHFSVSDSLAVAQFALQGKRPAARLKILCIIPTVVQVEELLIRLDGFGFL